MAQSSIVLQVILPSTERTDEILAATADRLDASGADWGEHVWLRQPEQ